MLMEVLITALIVGLIVVGTFTGIDVAQSTGISERDSNEAILLASESQEALRTDPAATFDSSTGVYEHVYTKTLDGETYTVTQKASFLNNSGEASACSATNTTRQESNSLRLSSVVTWPQQVAGKRAPVTVSGVTTPPAASALEIDVGNYPTPTAGVAGIATTVKYFPNESSTQDSLTGTTETPGCVVFSALPATLATVEVGEKPGYVDPAGAANWPTKTVTIAPNYTTHDPITLNEGGALEAKLQYKSSSSYKHKRNGSSGEEITEAVTGDTVVAYNELMGSSPNFELGSAKGSWSSGTYTPTFGTTSAETWKSAITTPIEASGTKFPHGNLFPFPTPGAWRVYAGACPANDPHTVSSSLTDATAYVSAGVTEPVTAQVAYLKMNVYSGSASSHGSFAETTAYPVTLTNTGCKSLTPDNETAINEPQETEDSTVSSGTTGATPEYGGHLEHPFLPFGAGSLCLAYNTTSPSTKHDTFTVTYDLTAEGLYERDIDLGEAKSSGTSEYSETLTGPGGSESVKVKVEASSGTATCP